MKTKQCYEHHTECNGSVCRYASPSAVFIGYQEYTDSRGPHALALYNVVGGERDKSTVSAPTLEHLGIMVPQTPMFGTWKREKENMK